MGPPLLRPALYGKDVVGVPTFSAFIDISMKSMTAKRC